MTKLKQVIVMRTDLNMRKGKMIAQGAHASLTAVWAGGRSTDQRMIDKWFEQGQRKICVRVESEEELGRIYSAAKKARLISELITDAGHTEFHGIPTKTCCAIGPGPEDEIDKITGELKLL